MRSIQRCSRMLDQLVVIDVQERLCRAMSPQELQAMLRNTSILLQAARILSIPFIYTEQAPTKLGSTISQLGQWLPADRRVEKTSFSCCEEDAFCAKLEADRPQIVLAGMESHICIVQTALQLLESGHHQVFVVEDAVISRNADNKVNALARLRQAGAVITNTESVVFEWVGNAAHDDFRRIAELIK